MPKGKPIVVGGVDLLRSMPEEGIILGVTRLLSLRGTVESIQLASSILISLVQTQTAPENLEHNAREIAAAFYLAVCDAPIDYVLTPRMVEAGASVLFNRTATRASGVLTDAEIVRDVIQAALKAQAGEP